MSSNMQPCQNHIHSLGKSGVTSTLMRSGETGGVACEKTWWRKLASWLRFVGACRACATMDHPFRKVSEGYSFRSWKQSERGSRKSWKGHSLWKDLEVEKNWLFEIFPKQLHADHGYAILLASRWWEPDKKRWWEGLRCCAWIWHVQTSVDTTAVKCNSNDLYASRMILPGRKMTLDLLLCVSQSDSCHQSKLKADAPDCLVSFVSQHFG